MYSMGNLAKPTLIVTAFSTVGLALTFLSNVIVASIFGAGGEMDVYLAVNALPVYVISMLSDALRFTFIPVFAEYRQKSIDETWTIVSSIVNVCIVVTGILCGIGLIFAAPIMRTLTPGFSAGQIDQATGLLRWLLPTIVLSVVSELISSVYYSNQKFFLPSLNRIIAPVLTIIYVLAFSDSLSVQSLVLATLTSASCQLLILLWDFAGRKEFRYSFKFHLSHDGVKKIARLMIPLIAGMILYRFVPLFDNWLGSGLPMGSISHIGYAKRLLLVISAIITTGVTASVFPAMAKCAAEKDYVELKRTMSKAIRVLMFLAVPFMILIGIFSRDVVGLLFERGSFGPSDTEATGLALSIYLLSLPLAALGTIVGQGYYVLQDTRTAAFIGVVEAIVYALAATVMVSSVGYLAMPIAYVAYFGFSTVNAWIVRKKLGGVGGRKILLSSFRHLVIALTTCALVWLATGSMENLTIKNAMIGAGFLIYLILSRWVIRTEESVSVTENLMAPFLKRSWKAGSQ